MRKEDTREEIILSLRKDRRQKEVEDQSESSDGDTTTKGGMDERKEFTEVGGFSLILRSLLLRVRASNELVYSFSHNLPRAL